MPIAERTASVVWQGSLARGGGTLESGSGALRGLPVTWAARTEAPGGKTSPEELIASATPFSDRPTSHQPVNLFSRFHCDWP